MTIRTLIGLVAALVALSVLVLLGQRADETPDSDALGTLLVPELGAELDGIDRIAALGAGGAPIATLEQREDHWAIVEKDGYPADLARIRAVLRGLAEARIVEQKTSNPQYYDRLGVQPIESETAGGVELTAWAGASEVAAVIVGDAAGSGYRYVRREEDQTSFLVDRDIEVPQSVAEWVDPTIVDIPGARVQRVTIEHPDGETVRIFKEDPEAANFTVADVPEDRELQYPGVANVIGNALRELRLEDVASASDDDGADGRVRTTFQTFDGLIVEVEGWSDDSDGAWVEVSADAAGLAESGAPEASGASDSAASDAAARAPDAVGAGVEDGDSPDAVALESEVDPAAEAATINARVSGWRYRIPSYQFDQITRRLEDLLQAPAEE